MSNAPHSGLSRRAAIRQAIACGTVAVLLPGCREQASNAAPAIFTQSERQTLAAIGEALVPGAAAAGIVDFVAAMLADADPMLCYRFVSFPMPPADFYKATLAAIADLSHGVIDAALIGRMLSPDLKGWQGPPPALAYFVIRNDAADVVYGGEDAYTRLDVPYMAHIAPPGRW
ncbi:MAG: gluconate 2-dehydrogenase subunit 3 family protein [Rhizomicrobium sp.]